MATELVEYDGTNGYRLFAAWIYQNEAKLGLHYTHKYYAYDDNDTQYWLSYNHDGKNWCVLVIQKNGDSYTIQLPRQMELNTPIAQSVM